MRYKKPIIVLVTALSVGAASFGVLAPAAMAADKPSASPTVSIDRAHDSATFTTKKGVKLTVKWEEFANGKRDLVTVRNSDQKLIAARTVADKRLEKVLTTAEKHPGALRHLWVEHGKKHEGKKSAAKK